MELENFLKQKVKEKKITKPLNKDAINLQLIDLLSRSYSQFHVVNNIKERLLKLGFVQLSEHNLTQIEKGKNYFITRNDSSLIAFKVPENISDIKFNITAAHTDSPTLKIKPNPVIKRNNVTLLNVEPYGGLIMPTWLDRPLSLAGRVYYEQEEPRLGAGRSGGFVPGDWRICHRHRRQAPSR
jgi:aspartyl aminopeptidase